VVGITAGGCGIRVALCEMVSGPHSDVEASLKLESIAGNPCFRTRSRTMPTPLNLAMSHCPSTESKPDTSWFIATWMLNCSCPIVVLRIVNFTPLSLTQEPSNDASGYANVV